jgi:hypothetical protein
MVAAAEMQVARDSLLVAHARGIRAGDRPLSSGARW